MEIPCLWFWQIVPLNIMVLQPVGARSSLAAQHRAGTLCSCSYTKVFTVGLSCSFVLATQSHVQPEKGASLPRPMQALNPLGDGSFWEGSQRIARMPRWVLPALRHPLSIPRMLFPISAQPQAASPIGLRDRKELRGILLNLLTALRPDCHPLSQGAAPSH